MRLSFYLWTWTAHWSVHYRTMPHAWNWRLRQWRIVFFLIRRTLIDARLKRPTVAVTGPSSGQLQTQGLQDQYSNKCLLNVDGNYFSKCRRKCTFSWSNFIYFLLKQNTKYIHDDDDDDNYNNYIAHYTTSATFKGWVSSLVIDLQRWWHVLSIRNMNKVERVSLR